ncbi:MAG: hypothetical protein R2852_00535 [Bacteroidia bacterium]
MINNKNFSVSSISIQRFLLIFSLSVIIVLSNSCRKSYVGKTNSCNSDFADSSSSHPKADIYQSILNTYKKKGLQECQY